ncbi:MAG: DUF4892 domain-containing protein [Betaproteobacteria bacterium]|nr:DUF4892 domain-containing protein [Betaproteobacteria bacterium]
MRVALACFITLCAVSSSPAVAAPLKDHPAVTPYAGSVATRRDEDGFRPYSLVTGVNDKGKSDDDGLRTLRVEGIVTRLAYENPKGRSSFEIFTNYREALEKGGFKILFACSTNACGPSYASSRWGRVTGMRYASSDMHYLAAQATRGGQDMYVAVLIAKVRHQVEIVEVGQMQKDLVTAKALGEGLRKEGRVVLDGIFFDTDKATIKAESKPALDTLAKFLAENASIRAHIVGHTDGSGDFAYNLQLSKNRAAAVMAALISDYKIAAERLAAHGVGPLAPAATNKSEDGRKQNRRVELVEM